MEKAPLRSGDLLVSHPPLVGKGLKSLPLSSGVDFESGAMAKFGRRKLYISRSAGRKIMQTVS